MSVNIKADFTCDNSYAVWLGDANSVHTKIKEKTNTTAAQIFSGEHFNFNASKSDYLYVIAWSDDSVKQGLVGSFNGGVSIHTGNPLWEVLPTDSDKDNNQFPSLAEINGFVGPSSTNDWKKPFVGPTNANTSSIYSNVNNVKGIPLDANWVWYNSNNSPDPFKIGFNHDEFLVFRIPVKSLTTCCGPCEEGQETYSEELKSSALKKQFIIQGEENQNKKIKAPYTEKMCSFIDLPNIEPSFYLHWGDSRRDNIETHDDEVLYITACNPYNNLSFKNLTILEARIVFNVGTLSNGEKEISLVPDKLICFDDLNGCSCSSREFTLLTRGAKPQEYTIEISYCIDAIEVNQNNSGKNSFKIELINS